MRRRAEILEPGAEPGEGFDDARGEWWTHLSHDCLIARSLFWIAYAIMSLMDCCPGTQGIRPSLAPAPALSTPIPCPASRCRSARQADRCALRPCYAQIRDQC